MIKKLGKLCPNNHNHDETGMSMRYASGTCVACTLMHTNKWKAKNKEHVNKKALECYYKNAEKNREKSRKKYALNREAELLRHKKYRQENLQKLRDRDKEIKRKERMNPEYRISANDYYKKNSIKIRLRNRVFKAINMFSKTGKVKTISDYGIDILAIINHIGKCPGNQSDWHIDHKEPLASFDMNDEAQIKAAFSPENHQWLPAKENHYKHAKPYKQYLAETGRLF